MHCFVPVVAAVAVAEAGACALLCCWLAWFVGRDRRFLVLSTFPGGKSCWSPLVASHLHS